jgi:hypothetical protein
MIKIDFSSLHQSLLLYIITMPAPSLVKLDFQEKLIQSGKKENTEALLKRIKVSISLEEEERKGIDG